jgi:hypothetical protein
MIEIVKKTQDIKVRCLKSQSPLYIVMEGRKKELIELRKTEK